MNSSLILQGTPGAIPVAAPGLLQFKEFLPEEFME
jgi:hypothetical protein